MIGIVVVSYNASDAVVITLRSLFRAKNEARFRLVVVDNASGADDRREIRDFVEAARAGQGIDCTYVQNEHNLGFSGGNNVGIRMLLADPSIEQICLLNGDVIVTDGWIDRQLAYGVPVISTVTNRADSEQCVPDTYRFTPEEVAKGGEHAFDSAYAKVQKLVEQRREAFRGCLVECDVTFFSVLMTRKVFEDVGLLDETFFPGGFEDDDYCLRLRAKGYPVALARDVYIHHFGSASFGKLEYRYFAGRAKENLRYLESKHGIKWQRRPEKPLVSLLMDLAHVATSCEGVSSLQADLIERHLKLVDRSVTHHASEFVNLRAEFLHSGHQSRKAGVAIERAERFGSLADNWAGFVAGLDTALAARNLQSAEAKALLESGAALAEGIKAVVDANFKINAALRGGTEHAAGPGATEWVSRHWAARSGISKVLWALGKGLQMLARFDGVVFFGGYFYPEREKDGYFQRIRMVDRLVSGGWRIYVESDELTGRGAVIDRPEPRVLVIRLLGGRAKKLVLWAMAAAFVLRSRKVYFHSVLRMGDHGFGRLLRLPFVKSVVDIHGVVPEEFRMHDDYYSAVKYEREEEKAFRHANRVVVVSDAMKEYLENKYRDHAAPEFIHFPMFPEFVPYLGAKGLDAGSKPIAVYAGGLHKWQQPEKTLRAMVATDQLCANHFLSPNPEAASELAAGIEGGNTIHFGSMSHDELMRFYRKCEFGYILRADSIVNNVACPTKIVEYLANGIIPVIDSDRIGDFAKLGMRAIQVEDFEQGRVPDADERARMSQANFRVYQAIKKARDRGARALSAYLSGDRAVNAAATMDLASHGAIDVLVQVGNFEAGGLENVVLELNEFLRDYGLRLVLLVLGTQGPAAERARSLGQPIVAMPYSEVGYRELLQQLKPKVVLSHYSIEGIPVCAELGIPVMQVVHNIYMWLSGGELAAFREAAAQTTRFIAVSEAAKDYSVRRLGVDPDTCDVIPNGIEVERFCGRDRMAARNRLRALHGIPANDFVFLDMAAINHQKNHGDVIKAFSLAAIGCDNARLVILGPVYEPALLKEMKSMVRDLGIGHRVHIIEPTASPWEFYAMADAFVSASFFEGGPLTLLEALASNLPVIIPRIGVASAFEGMRGVHVIDPAIDIGGYEGSIDGLASGHGFVDSLAGAMMRVWCDPVRPDFTEEQRGLLEKDRAYIRYAQTIVGEYGSHMISA
ncbi:MAG: glycosyltransferase [Pseudoxanthomonas sp.]|nr:glycosyltransferase [Pseudoxanthomonas sp.]